MLAIARRILVARAAAAIFSMASNIIALRMLPGDEYAKGAVAIAGAAIALPIFFQPFSKYMLVTGRWASTGGLFWRLQPVSAAAIVLIATGLSAASGLSFGLVLSAAIFSISQGWKETCGEMSRSMADISRMGRLYVGDAVTTALLTVGALYVTPTAEMFLLSSAVSSVAWSLFLTPFPRLGWQNKIHLSAILAIYRYSVGLSIATFLNSSTIAVGRMAIKQASPAELAGAIQFLLDLLQKVIALMASSLLSAAIPEARRRSVSGLLPAMTAVLLFALVGLICLSWAVVVMPIGVPSQVGGLPLGLAALCALYAWVNRYKGSILDMPLISSETKSFFVTAGAVISLGIVSLLSKLHLDVPNFMLWASAAVGFGGTTSAALAWRFGLIEWRDLFYVVTIPMVLLIFVKLWILSV